MKRITALLCIVALVFSLCSCSFYKLKEQDNDNMNEQIVGVPDSSGNVSSEDEFDYSSVSIQINIGYNEDTYEEEGTVVAKDKDGNTLWSYVGGKYPAAQLESYSEIGKYGSNYYYSEGGTVVALDIETGKPVWKNSDFGGYSVKHVFGEDAIYLCGYFGPDFFAVSYSGATLKRIDTINNDYWWAYKLEEKDGKIAVYFDGSEDENGGVFYVDTATYVVTR